MASQGQVDILVTLIDTETRTYRNPGIMNLDKFALHAGIATSRLSGYEDFEGYFFPF
jgi:hypothetical protein